MLGNGALKRGDARPQGVQVQAGVQGVNAEVVLFVDHYCGQARLIDEDAAAFSHARHFRGNQVTLEQDASADVGGIAHGDEAWPGKLRHVLKGFFNLEEYDGLVVAEQFMGEAEVADVSGQADARGHNHGVGGGSVLDPRRLSVWQV